MARKLVIVESPTKARKIAGYLGNDYEVASSVGHIRDLPQPSELPAEMKKGPFGKFAVDVENGFEPYYEVYADKRSTVRELKRSLKECDELYLATDEDREGEAIAWHLIAELKPKVPVKRMVFHEITREAITRALATTRDLNANLVDAQETRRILDRLYGYEVSPVLWRKVRQGLSAGRVQSVATRLVVEREQERMAFVSASYWDVIGQFAPVSGADAGRKFGARLTAIGAERVATGRDFDDLGRLKVKTGVAQLDEATATSVAAGLTGAEFAVRSLETKPYTRKPAAPFTTSTLQQEAGRKLRMNARATMRTAQALYENGYITYMRTDSPSLSAEAITAARAQATELYGAASVPGAPRLYQSRSAGAQEAHEAIRPAGDSFRTPAQVRSELSGDQFRLYELIWKRTVASQMADAKGSTASVRLGATLGAAAGGLAGRDAVFSASGTVITFRGFLAAYEEGTDDGTSGVVKEARLPQMSDGDALTAADLATDGHSTSAPPRFTEASLVKTLEELGIGRPSTYASTISTVQDRGYVRTVGQALVPTWLAFAVTKLLMEHFGSLVDYQFTAAMEADLDQIAAGQRKRAAWLEGFYFGTGSQAEAGSGIPGAAAGGAGGGLKHLVDTLGEIDPVSVNSVEIGEGLRVRVGRYGPYVEDTLAPVADGANPPRASVPDTVAPDELTVAMARELLAAGGDEGRSLGVDPVTGHEIVARAGRYGPYVTEVLPEVALDEGLSAAARKKALAAAPKPRTGSLFKDMSLETVTLDDALKLLSLPRIVGVDPTDGAEITAQNGRYGPYLKKGADSRTIASEAQLLTITLDEALAIYAQPKQRGAARAAAAPLRAFGADPTSGRPIVIKDGRFGAYVTDGETNRTLPRDLTPETITEERAIELLAEKRAAGPVKRGGRKPATPKKPVAKKAASAKKAPVEREPGSMQVYKLATELGITSKELLTALKTVAPEIKTAFSYISPAIAEQVRTQLSA
ncbi:MAG: type I DNA topoisomerase [Promicromonosporaceae bacterium]|nr:type I DNA topoisomerase [Promicromonosporaceae bacterium]